MGTLSTILGVIMIILMGAFVIWMFVKQKRVNDARKSLESQQQGLEVFHQIENSLRVETNFYKEPYAKKVNINGGEFLFTFTPEVPKPGLRITIERLSDNKGIMVKKYIPKELLMGGPSPLLVALKVYLDAGFFHGEENFERTKDLNDKEWNNEWAKEDDMV